MKPMLRYLPTEVWMDVLVYLFMIRAKLGQMGNRIGNRRFAEILQGFLHEWGRLRLSNLSIIANQNNGIDEARVLPHHRKYTLEFAQTELPENIRSFSLITIEHFNDQVLEFLRLLQPIFTNVQLYINARFEPQFAENMRIILTHLLPMINGVDRICCSDSYGFDMMAEHFAGALSSAKMFHFQIWTHHHHDERILNFPIPWLTAPERGPNEPKLLTMIYNFTPKSLYHDILEAVQKQFTSSNTRSTFAIFFADFREQVVSEFQMENNQTGEMLTGRHKHTTGEGWNFSYFEVCRHQIGSEAQLQQWLGENAIWNKEIGMRDNNSLFFYRPTIGSKMKLMLRYLPTEVWMDVLVYLFMIRAKLGQMGNRIGNRKFAEYLQCFLHEWGRLRLTSLSFVPSSERYGAARLLSYRQESLEFAQTALPENIRSFSRIRFKHFDNQVLQFLQLLQPLFTNVKLYINARYEGQQFVENRRIILTHLLPMINGIDTIDCCDSYGFNMMIKHFAGALSRAKMIHFFLWTDQDARILNFSVQWLTGPERGPNEPKLLMLSYNYYTKANYHDIYKAIREQFTSANARSTFAIFFCEFGEQVSEFQNENAQTGEMLIGRHKQTIRQKENWKFSYFEVCRFKIGAEAQLQQWLAENSDWHEEMPRKDTNSLYFYRPTIGSEMKPMLRFLPTEVWMDVFVYLFMIRTRLAQMGNRIGNRKFAEILQGFLHDWGRLRLPSLSFVPSSEHYGAARLLSCRQESLEFAQTELPENIRLFSRIRFEYFNIEVLEFLHLLQPLFTNVKLHINAQFELQFAENMRIILTHLLPMINGIDTIFCGDPLGLDMLATNFAGALSRAKMFHFYIWTHRDARICNFSVQWLTAPERGPDEPKLLTMFYNFTPKFIYDEILKAIKEQFISANARSTFAIFFAEFSIEFVSEFQIENAQTGELLTGRHKSAEKSWQFSYFEVCRHQIGAEAQLQQWLAENANWNKEIAVLDTNHIGFYRPMIGNIEEPWRWFDAVDVGEERDGLIQL